MAGTFLEGLNLLSISAILGGDGDGGLGSVRRSVRLRPGLDRRRTDKGGGCGDRSGGGGEFSCALLAVKELYGKSRFITLFFSFLPSLLPCLMQIRTTYGTRTPLARPLANLQENCKANSAAALLLLCLLAPGQIFAISWRFHFCVRECMTKSDGETLAVSMGNMGSAKKNILNS